jgi:hypothetical protein
MSANGRLLILALLAGFAQAQDPTVSSYLPSTKRVPGKTVCNRILTLQLQHPGEAITAENDGAGTIQDCLDVDIAQPDAAGTLYVGGGKNGGIRTDLGFHIGDRDWIIGQNVGAGGNSVTPNTGTNFMGSSRFPTGRDSGAGVTATGSAGQSVVRLALATGGPDLIIGPLEEFRLAGDPTRYTFDNCTVACAEGKGKWYALLAGSEVAFNITPPLKTSPANTPVRLIKAMFRFGDQWHGSPQEGVLLRSFINGDSIMGNLGIGMGIMNGQEGQENDRAEDVYIRNISQAIKIFQAHRSGTWRNLNVAYTNESRGCPTPGDGMPPTIPMELAPYNTTVDGFTLYVGTGGPCTPKQMIYGGIHITDSPLFTQPFGVLRVLNWHVEMNGDQADGTVTGDGVLVDSTGGNIEMDNGTLCPKASGCKNGIRIAANFRGVFDLRNTSCNAKGGTTNLIADDVNHNVLPCAEILNATGFYRITHDGTAITDVLCSAMTNGFCFNKWGWSHYIGGVNVTILLRFLILIDLLILTLIVYGIVRRIRRLSVHK